MAQPKGKPSNNQKKKQWYCFTSKESMKKLLEAQGILEIFDTYKIKSAHKDFFIEDVLEFINRECRVVRINKN
jgi:hypothetical protein